MTARKNQAQPIILKAVLVIGPFRRFRLRFEISHQLVLDASNLARRRRVSMALNRAVEINHGRGLPGIPLFGHRLSAVAKASCIRLLGKIKITEQADQSCQDSSRIHAIKRVEQFGICSMERSDMNADLSKPATSNQFGKRRIDAKSRCT